MSDDDRLPWHIKALLGVFVFCVVGFVFCMAMAAYTLLQR